MNASNRFPGLPTKIAPYTEFTRQRDQPLKGTYLPDTYSNPKHGVSSTDVCFLTMKNTY